MPASPASQAVTPTDEKLELTEEEIEHIAMNWRPVALCQLCRDIIEKLDAHISARRASMKEPE